MEKKSFVEQASLEKLFGIEISQPIKVIFP